MEHAEFIRGLRNAADFFEARPELGLPYQANEFRFYGTVCGLPLDSRESMVAFAKIAGGRTDKEESDNLYYLTAKRDGFSVRAAGYRAHICEKIEVGVKIVPAHIIPAQKEQLVPEREVPIYEWRCPPLLHKDAPDDPE